MYKHTSHTQSKTHTHTHTLTKHIDMYIPTNQLTLVESALVIAVTVCGSGIASTDKKS